MKTLGEKIRYYRKKEGWSQEDLAARLNITMLSISNIERNVTDVQYSRLEQLAKAFGITASELVSFSNTPTEYVALKNKIKEQEKEIIDLQRKLLRALEKRVKNL
jgi:transcriptional regulator with XRE-family HTH domain